MTVPQLQSLIVPEAVTPYIIYIVADPGEISLSHAFVFQLVFA
jgi:hypothetical protein